MENVMLLNAFINAYNNAASTHNYIFGFEFQGNIYATFTDSSVLPFILKLDKASSKNGGGYSLRFQPNRKQKFLLLSLNSKIVCSADFFNNECKNSKYNKGEIFEKLLTEKYQQEWKKDNTSFTIDGDLTINEISYQIKFYKGTFMNEREFVKM